MIVDLHAFTTTGPSSRRRIECMCDNCGRTGFISKRDITRRKGSRFTICQLCNRSVLGKRNKGRVHSATTRAKMAAWPRTGRKPTEETLAKMRIVATRYTPEESRRRALARAALRNILNSSLMRTGQYKSASAIALLGYTSQQLRDHVERQFYGDMTWGNRDSFQIDHMFPVTAFLDHGITDPKIINCLQNLRPLLPIENASKFSKYNPKAFAVWLFEVWGIHAEKSSSIALAQPVDAVIRKTEPSGDDLRTAYVHERLSLIQMRERFGYGQIMIVRLMDKHGIPRRPSSCKASSLWQLPC